MSLGHECMRDSNKPFIFNRLLFYIQIWIHLTCELNLNVRNSSKLPEYAFIDIKQEWLAPFSMLLISFKIKSKFLKMVDVLPLFHQPSCLSVFLPYNTPDILVNFVSHSCPFIISSLLPWNILSLFSLQLLFQETCTDYLSKLMCSFLFTFIYLTILTL